MIVVEGPDGAGKSTLVKHICEKFNLSQGVRTAPRDRLWETTVADTYEALRAAADPTMPCLVWDRMFWSEMVYSKVMGRKCAFSFPAYQHCLGVVRAADVPVIVCYPPFEVVKANVTGGKHPMKGMKASFISENIETIHDMYAGMIASQNVVWYDYTGEDGEGITGVTERIVEYLALRNDLAILATKKVPS